MRIAYLLLAFATVLPSHAGWLTLRRTGQETTAGVEYYVSLNGNDRNAGGRATPFLTLEKARQMVREQVVANALPKGGVCVFIRKGTYLVPEGFVLDEKDTGSARADHLARLARRRGAAGGRQAVGGRGLPASCRRGRAGPVGPGSPRQCALR